MVQYIMFLGLEELFGIRLELRNSKGIFLENGSNIYKAAEGTES